MTEKEHDKNGDEKTTSDLRQKLPIAHNKAKKSGKYNTNLKFPIVITVFRADTPETVDTAKITNFLCISWIHFSSHDVLKSSFTLHH